MFSYSNSIVQEDLYNIFKSSKWDAFNNKNILITGANGHIASYMAFAFGYAIEKGVIEANLIVNSRNKEKLISLYSQFIGKKWFHLEIGDVKELKIMHHPIDFIFHFAGNASPFFIKNDPVGILQANISGTFHICELAKQNPGCKVIYSSSREVYGDNKEATVLGEHSFGGIDPLDSRSAYPESKRAAETIIKAYALQYGIGYDILRIAHCYGPGMKLENDGRVMSDFLYYALNDKAITLFSSGTALRAFCYISDVIRGVLIVTIYSNSGVFNLSNENEEISIREVAEIISEMTTKKKIDIQARSVNTGIYTAYKRKPLDCSTLIKLGWRPTVNLKDGLFRTIKSFRI